MVIAGTGGGKSAFTLNLTQQLIEQDYTVVVVEFGKSFSQLCRLYPDISLHVDYDGRTALGINPFDLQGEELDNGSIEDALGGRAEILEAHVHKERVGEGGGPHPFHPGLLRECP